jgi:hypothetical protein
MAVTCLDITMYDPRDTVKAVAAEAIGLGESCYIHSDGLAYVVDNGKSDVCHGWALKAYAAGDEVTLVTACRMKPNATQTKGARVYTGAIAGGSCPSTTLAAGGLVVGFAMSAEIVYLRTLTPGADG